MTPEQALELLNNAASQMQLNRATHVELVKAVEVLRTIITPKEDNVDGNPTIPEGTTINKSK